MLTVLAIAIGTPIGILRPIWRIRESRHAQRRRALHQRVSSERPFDSSSGLFVYEIMVAPMDIFPGSPSAGRRSR